MASSKLVSWREVIRRQSTKDKKIEQPPAEQVKMEADTEEEYISAQNSHAVGSREGYPEGELINTSVSDAFSYPGTNQTIVCQVIPSRSVF